MIFRGAAVAGALLLGALVLAGCGGEVKQESMFEAAEKGDFKTIMKGVQAGFDADTRDEQGETLLHKVVRARNGELAVLLIERYSFAPRVENNEGKTPLDIAVDLEYYDVADDIAASGG